MGLGDFFGGKKMPAPPVELRKSANAAFNLAGDFSGRVGELGGYTDSFLSRFAPHLTDTLARDYGDARTAAIGQKDVFGNLFEKAGAPILWQQAAETAAAGSQERQADEANLARDSVLSAVSAQQEGLADSMRRRGIVGGVSDSPHVAALTAASAASAANDARRTERNYGEQVRRAYAPMATGFADTEIARQQQGAGFAQAELGAREMLPALAAGAYGREGQLTNTAANLYGNASNLYSGAYAADVQKAQADNERNAAIWGNLTKLGGMVAGGVGGFAGGGGWTGAATGAYNASQGMPITSSSIPAFSAAGRGTNFMAKTPGNWGGWQ